MKKSFIKVFVISISVLLFYTFSAYSPYALVNPASKFCEDDGYVSYTIADVDGGQKGMCKIGSENSCDEWEYFCKCSSSSNLYCSKESTSSCLAPCIGVESFKDMQSEDTYFATSQYIKRNAIAKGFTDGSFRPGLSISRKEIIRMIIGAKYSLEEIDSCLERNGYIQLTPDEGVKIFSDIEASHQFAKFICMAKEKNIVVGYSDGSFGPDIDTNFPQAVTMIVRALDELNPIPSGSGFDAYIARLKEKNAFPPTISAVNFDRKITRAETAHIIKAVREDYIGYGSQVSNGFCGISQFDFCTTDSSCTVSGCSGQVCASWASSPIFTTCEYKSCFNSSFYGLGCKCYNNRCQWK
jgi:eight-cysteine-cluster-containing protein